MSKKETIRRWVRRHQGKHFCLCGCGQPIEIKASHYKNKIPKFIRGHNFSSDYNPKVGNLNSVDIKRNAPSWEIMSEEEKEARIARLHKFGSMEDHYNWKGGRHIDGDGYIHIRKPDHPYAQGGYVLEHRLVMEEYLKETLPDSFYLIKINGTLYLRPTIIVHHINEKKDCNTIDNLFPMTAAEHVFWHKSLLPDDEKLKIILSGKYRK